MASSSASDRPRGQVVAHADPPLGHGPARQPARELLALGVHGHRQAQARRARHSLQQRQVVGGLELLHPAGRHEGLEADDAAGRELVEAVAVAGDEPAPQRHVDARDARRRRDLGVEGGAVDRRRDRVERHVDRARRPAGRQRGGAGGEALPVGAPGLVEVDVGVDHAGQDEQPARVDLLARRAGELGPDGDDPPVGHGEVALVAADQQVDVAHARQPADEGVQHVERHGHVGLVDGLVGVVADAAGAAHEEHRDAGQLRERHRRRGRRRWPASPPAARARPPPPTAPRSARRRRPPPARS